jgi:hypothetical protein
VRACLRTPHVRTRFAPASWPLGLGHTSWPLGLGHLGHTSWPPASHVGENAC